MLPTFLGIGVPRGGTTWLHNLLHAHPQAYVPVHRKEVHFFDQNYGRGVQWYEQFFPLDDTSQYKCLGEITPHYLYCQECPSRIAQLPSIKRLIVMLRNPVDRAYSHYLFRARLDNYRGSFSDFLTDYPHAVEWGMYSSYLKEYFRFFDRGQMLILLYEHDFNDIDRTKGRIADFLGIDPALYPLEVGQRKVNKSYLPRMRFAYRVATSLGNLLIKHEQYWATTAAKRLGVKNLFGINDAALPALSTAMRRVLVEKYRGEINTLEALLKIELDCWRVEYDEGDNN